MYERFYRSLYRIRTVEEQAAKIYWTDKIKSPMHLSIGQEAVSVGVCEALRQSDIVFPTYRGHAAYLAKGGDLNAMVAELYGKATGCAKGKGGSMHLVDVVAGVMGASAVVGTTIPHAVGYAFATRSKSIDQVVASFFGDGAVEEGVFAESLNFAALRNVPLLFICENNSYAIHTPLEKRQAHGDVCTLARAYGVPATRIEGNDTEAMFTAVSDAVGRMRAGGGPEFFECMTYRWKEHVGPGDDFHTGYRSEDEAAPWKAEDQIEVIGSKLDAGVRTRITREVDDEVAAAFDFAERSPFPEPAELYTNVFSSG